MTKPNAGQQRFGRRPLTRSNQAIAMFPASKRTPEQAHREALYSELKERLRRATPMKPIRKADK